MVPVLDAAEPLCNVPTTVGASIESDHESAWNSHPFAGSPSRSYQVASQTSVHVPPEHDQVEWGTAAGCAPQATVVSHLSVIVPSFAVVTTTAPAVELTAQAVPFKSSI